MRVEDTATGPCLASLAKPPDMSSATIANVCDPPQRISQQLRAGVPAPAEKARAAGPTRPGVSFGRGRCDAIGLTLTNALSLAVTDRTPTVSPPAPHHPAHSR